MAHPAVDDELTRLEELCCTYAKQRDDARTERDQLSEALRKLLDAAARIVR